MVVVGLLVAIARSGHTSTPHWEQLDVSGTGQTIGQGGGSGSGSVELPVAAHATVLNFACANGTGTAVITVDSQSASVRCFEQPTVYTVTLARPVSARRASVTAPSGALWRLVVSGS